MGEESGKVAVKCSVCGKVVYRSRRISNAKCKECKRREQKNRYRHDRKFRNKIIERSKKRYRQKTFPIFKLTRHEKALLKELSVYPVISPKFGTIGTSGPTANTKIIEVDGKQRVKGAVWLENWIEKRKRKKKKS